MLSGYILPVDWYVCCCDASGPNDRLDLRYRPWVILGSSASRWLRVRSRRFESADVLGNVECTAHAFRKLQRLTRVVGRFR